MPAPFLPALLAALSQRQHSHRSIWVIRFHRSYQTPKARFPAERSLFMAA